MWLERFNSKCPLRGLWGQREGRGREVPGLGFSAEREAVLSPGQCRSGPGTLGPAIGPKLGQPGR